MAKKIKNIIALMLAVCMLFATACDMGQENKGDGVVNHGTINLWTVPGVVNPLRNADYSEKYTQNPVLEIELSKNEYEAGQIMITPTGDVKSYTLSVSNLSDTEGNIISKENIKIYNQHYVELTNLSIATSNRPLGFYPDALIPQHLSEKVKENVIGAGNNQAILLDVYAPAETPAGLYSGTCTLKVDHETFYIPIRVKVRDFTLSDTNHVQSSVYLFPEYIMGGDLDNTPESYAKYVDFLLDYRICTNNIVYPYMNDYDLLVEEYKKYAADPRVSSYALTSHISFEEDIRMLIENSTPQLNLIEKLMIYGPDEPYTFMAEAKKTVDGYVDRLIAIANSYTDEQLASYGVTRAQIEGVEVLSTVTATIAELEGLRTYCGLTSSFHTEQQREAYKRFQEEAYKGANNELEGTDYGSTWWYVCNHPYEPYPNWHIDREMVIPRVTSWMQYDYDIDGILYWSSAGYFNTDTIWGQLSGWESVPVYDKASAVFAAGGTNGEGYIVYPGAKYGESGPLPSIRLINIRDGFEDYQNLLYLETKMDEYVQKYDLEGVVDFDTVMNPIYDTLYEGTIASTDYTRLMTARETVMDMIELLASDAQALLVTNPIDVMTNSIKVDVYAKVGTTMKVGDQEITGVAYGDGVKLSYTQSLEGSNNLFIATLKVGEQTVEIAKPLGSAIKVVDDCSSSENISKWVEALRLGTTDYIDISINENPDYVLNGDKSLKVVLDNGNWTAWEATNFISNIKMSASDFFGTDNYKQVDYVEINLYNASSVTFDLDFRFEIKKGTAKERSQSMKKVTVQTGWNKIKIPYINEMTWMNGQENLLDYITGIMIQFEMIEQDIEVYIDSVFYTYVK